MLCYVYIFIYENYGIEIKIDLFYYLKFLDQVYIKKRTHGPSLHFPPTFHFQLLVGLITVQTTLSLTPIRHLEILLSYLKRIYPATSIPPWTSYWCQEYNRDFILVWVASSPRNIILSVVCTIVVFTLHACS